jgi:hypothetical protein
VRRSPLPLRARYRFPFAPLCRTPVVLIGIYDPHASGFKRAHPLLHRSLVGSLPLSSKSFTVALPTPDFLARSTPAKTLADVLLRGEIALDNENGVMDSLDDPDAYHDDRAEAQLNSD